LPRSWSLVEEEEEEEEEDDDDDEYPALTIILLG
jgi:hypothetical protein